MTELDKLENILKERKMAYVRIDNDRSLGHPDRHQIIVYDKEGNVPFDAICHRGSYGYEQGLLEIYGRIVDVGKYGDSVVGHLTADDVIAIWDGAENDRS